MESSEARMVKKSIRTLRFRSGAVLLHKLHHRQAPLKHFSISGGGSTARLIDMACALGGKEGVIVTSRRRKSRDRGLRLGENQVPPSQSTVISGYVDGQLSTCIEQQ